MKLRPIQSEMLFAAAQARGLVALAAVGTGKTLVAFLLGTVLQAKRPLLLVPAAMRAQCAADFARLSDHWRVPLPRGGEQRGLMLRSYEELSSPKKRRLLFDLAPDLIVADEAHHLRSRSAVRTKRLERYLAATPRCRFCALSGTLLSGSVRDVEHLVRWATRRVCALPTGEDWEAWVRVLDEGSTAPEDKEAYKPLEEATGVEGPAAFRQLFLRAPGLCASREGGTRSTLYIEQRRPEVPEGLAARMRTTEKTWQTPDGDEIESRLRLGQVLRQLAMGFWYYWEWPGGVVDREWLEARGAWNRAVREVLLVGSEAVDSPALVARACERALRRGDAGGLPPDVLAAWRAWRALRKRPPPPTRIAWASDYLVNDAVAWARQGEGAVLWYDHQAVALRARQLTGWPVFGGGRAASEALRQLADQPGAPPCVLASVAAHSAGKNLQRWGRAIVVAGLAEATRWEQLLGRLHRAGQRRDEVMVAAYAHGALGGALAAARADAELLEGLGAPQRLRSAVWTD